MADEHELKCYVESLTQLFQYVGTENCVLCVLYPNRSAFQREHKVSMTQPTGFEPQGTNHTFADDGFPACGSFNDWQSLMAIEQYMQNYNFAQMA